MKTKNTFLITFIQINLGSLINKKKAPEICIENYNQLNILRTFVK